MSSDTPILIIAGPTAVGKTDASILLARQIGAEIVSADSMQIYRGMDIGTAKPSAEERRTVYHHMIDIVSPDQPYSVGDYLRDARAAIKIHPNDLRRTVRALEVYYLRDRKLSEFQREHAFGDRPYRFTMLFLVRSRKELYPRIEKRVDRMIEGGLEAEVRRLLDRGYPADLVSMQGLG